MFANCPCTVHEIHKHFFSTKLLLKMDLMVLFTHLNFSFQFLILSKIKGCLVFFFVITPHSIFITHYLKYPNFPNPTRLDTVFNSQYSKFSTFCGPHTCNLVQLLLFFFFFFFPFNPQYPNSPNPVKEEEKKKKKKKKIT